ncbi:MAG: 4-hydroxy-tetrahydrodipicolinate synthase [Lachnospiraceae bacterium]|nr:4-hydroxy-tetrahydrodipicolinate synthase [Lachnospiraceae bacterium]
MSLFTGAGVAIVTPMHENGDVNYEVFGELVEQQIAGGTDAIIVCGTTGEASTLTHEEHLECIRFVVNKVNKRIPVIAGTGSNCTKTAVYLSQEAENIGADGVLLVSPYYNKATQNGLKNHFVTIAKSIKIPVILYNIQGRTGINIEPTTIAAIAKEAENVVAVKEASGNISQVAQIARLTEGKLDIYSGNDDQIIPILSLGGKGVISVFSNIAPKQTHDMCEEYFKGNVEKAKDLQLEALDLMKALFCEVNPIPIKAAMNLMGMNVGSLRAPLTEMEDANKEKLAAAMKEYGLL